MTLHPKPGGWTDPPHATPDLAGIGGVLRVEAEDFEVEEIPAYEPCGEGEHLFLRVRKRDLTTPEAARRLASALELDPRSAGWAGLKDKRAVTTQWISFLGGDVNRALEVRIEDVEVLAGGRHGNKLRAGHLRSNRFRLRLRRSTGDVGAAKAVLDRLTTDGAPNYFGAQRFGHAGRNVERALAWLRGGGRAPRSRFDRKMLVSALQSAMFNEATAGRVESGTLCHAVDGDLLRKEDSGGLFVADSLEEAERRVGAWEVSPTGPMFGPRMRWPEREALAAERALLSRWALEETSLGAARKVGAGTRRPYRIRPLEVEIELLGGDPVLSFTLPPGGYATTIAREVTKGEATARASGPVSQ
jgi:tRNA pseudouridine13 synthase